jgi:hypothetical protein
MSSSVMLTRNSKSGHFCVDLDLRGKGFTFSTLMMMFLLIHFLLYSKFNRLGLFITFLEAVRSTVKGLVSGEGFRATNSLGRR